MLDGSIVAGKFVRRCVERHRRDLEEGKARGLYFDPIDAQFAIECFSFFRHSKGAFAGQSFVLSAWQAFIIWCLFGWKKSTGVRRFTRAYIEVARKNGKTTFLAGILIILFALDGEAGAEVYCAATKKDQARIVFNEAQRMVKASPELREFIRSYRNNLNVPATNSKMEPLSSDANSLDGLNPHAAGIDELHAHKTREVYDVLDTATGARAQALLTSITTAGFNQDGICYEVRTYGIDVLNQVVDDDNYFFYIAAIDDEDDWQDEACWAKANPNLGISASIEDLRAKAKRAKRSAAALNNFLIKHLDRWTQQATRWLPIEKWDACKVAYTEDELAGRLCYGGLDVAHKNDLECFAAVFPPDETFKKWRFLFRFWMPANTIQQRADEGDFRYKQWAKEGVIRISGEDSIDSQVVREEIVELSKLFKIEQIGYDPWSAKEIAEALGKEDIQMVEVRQNYAHLSEASKEFEAMIISKRVEQDGNSLMRWNIDNVSILSDNNANIRPVKPKDQRKKVDGVVAAIIALSRATVVMPEGPSVYEERGALIF